MSSGGLLAVLRSPSMRRRPKPVQCVRLSGQSGIHSWVCSKKTGTRPPERHRSWRFLPYCGSAVKPIVDGIKSLVLIVNPFSKGRLRHLSVI